MEHIYVPDTSVIIEGTLSDLIKKGKVKQKVAIHNAVVAELEHQANYGKEIGFMGLDEIKLVRELCKKKGIELDFVGDRPGSRQIKGAKSGEIDAMIRDLAWDSDGTLITADKVQHRTAEALGIKTIFIEIEKVKKKLKLDKYFDKRTMSIHLKEGVLPYAKKGSPGKWDFVVIEKKKLDEEALDKLARNTVEVAETDPEAWVEIERRGSTIVQAGKHRIVITRPPFSDGLEITAVRPIVEFEIEDYKLEPRIVKRLEKKAEGILVAGPPGAGKTTFARALALFYLRENRIIKTIEAPRDLMLPKEITQYSKNLGSYSEIHDILLLSRPDYTIFDEMRNTKDFRLYSDLRLAGVGLVGVIHGTSAIDTVQRFIGKIELGMITSIIDTVIFIESGKVDKVYDLKMTVKMPTGMVEADLARPVIEVRDFLNGTLEYEIYTFGEETVVVPISEELESKSLISKEEVADVVKRYIGDENVLIETPGGRKAIIFADDKDVPKLIGKDGKTVRNMERELGAKVDIRKIEERAIKQKKEVKFKMRKSGGNLILGFPKNLSGMPVDFYIGNEFLFSATIGKKGEVRLDAGSDIAKTVKRNIDSGRSIFAKV